MNGELAGPSTPSSKKRSKWDDLVENDENDVPKENTVIKKRAKVKNIRTHDLNQPPPAPGTKRTDRISSNLPNAHSRHVPARTAHPPFVSSRSVYSYERLNQIEEGSYGIVFRARDKQTGDIVALKKLKLDDEKFGFPITSLREINALIACKHENVVGIREIVVGDTLTQIFIVMDFIEHDLKSLLTLMPKPFLQSEIKTLLRQLLSAVAHCHKNWILHRDLKTSNLLMNNRGTIKVADFGLARRFGDPVGVGGMTQLVVTLWYRAPEILLGAETYSTAIDMWSVGCIFGELLLKEPVFQSRNEIEQLSMVFKLLGPPTSSTWPTFRDLPLVKTLSLPPAHPSQLPRKFPFLSNAGLDLLSRLLTYDPERRINAVEALDHPYFSEAPVPKHPDLFASFPSVAAGEKPRKKPDSPSAPIGAPEYRQNHFDAI